MANIFTQQPIYLDTDTTTGAGTNWRGANGGAQLNPGNLPSNLQQGAVAVSRMWGIKPWMIKIAQADAAVATVAGNVVFTDPQTTGGSGQLFKFPVITTTQPIIILTSGFASLWRDFIVTGLTATKVAIEIYYKA